MKRRRAQIGPMSPRFRAPRIASRTELPRMGSAGTSTVGLLAAGSLAARPFPGSSPSGFAELCPRLQWRGPRRCCTGFPVSGFLPKLDKKAALTAFAGPVKSPSQGAM